MAFPPSQTQWLLQFFFTLQMSDVKRTFAFSRETSMQTFSVFCPLRRPCFFFFSQRTVLVLHANSSETAAKQLQFWRKLTDRNARLLAGSVYTSQPEILWPAVRVARISEPLKIRTHFLKLTQTA